MFAKKHCEVVASILHKHITEFRCAANFKQMDILVEHFADVFEQDSSKFDHGKFIDAVYANPTDKIGRITKRRKKIKVIRVDNTYFCRNCGEGVSRSTWYRYQGLCRNCVGLLFLLMLAQHFAL